MDEEVEITVKYFDEGPKAPDGAGWYAWESEYPEEGYFYVGKERPTAEQLKEICPSYVEEKAKHVDT